MTSLRLLEVIYLYTELTELLPGIMNQLGPDNINHLKQIADSMSLGSGNAQESAAVGAGAVGIDDDDDDVPDLVENFEDVSKM